MSSNVGLSTPRGSGTSGYVQKNRSYLKPRPAPYSKDHSNKQNSNTQDLQNHKYRQPDQAILEHDRKRRIEVQVFELRDRLEDEGVDEDEIDEQCDALRTKLQSEAADSSGPGKRKVDVKDLKGYQVHELAEAKLAESEKLRKALGIKKDYEEGSHWRRQEERRRARVEDGDGGERERR